MKVVDAAANLSSDKRFRDTLAKKDALLEQLYELQSTVSEIDMQLATLVETTPDAVRQWYRELVRVGGQHAFFYPGAPWSYPTNPL